MRAFGPSKKEYMFEDLKIFGKALQNYGDEQKDKEEEKPLLEEYDQFLKAKEEYEPTKEQEEAGSIEDYGTQSAIDILLEKEKSDKEEKDLDKKIANIQKIIGTFTDAGGDTSVMKTENILNKGSTDINLSPIDYGSVKSKEYLTELFQKPSSQMDRVSLLYQNLKKQGLI